MTSKCTRVEIPKWSREEKEGSMWLVQWLPPLSSFLTSPLSTGTTRGQLSVQCPVFIWLHLAANCIWPCEPFSPSRNIFFDLYSSVVFWISLLLWVSLSGSFFLSPIDKLCGSSRVPSIHNLLPLDGAIHTHGFISTFILISPQFYSPATYSFSSPDPHAQRFDWQFIWNVL